MLSDSANILSPNDKLLFRKAAFQLLYVIVSGIVRNPSFPVSIAPPGPAAARPRA